MTGKIQSIFSVSEVGLVYRNKVKPADRPKVLGSDTAFGILINAWDLNKIDLVEQFNILLLNKANHCIGFSYVATGGSAACIADPKIIFVTAIKANASSIIVAHNHPSGNLKPSNADLKLTEQLVQAGKFLSLPVTDHLIVTPLKYFSFADEGLI